MADMNKRLGGKVALVTGGSRGIGAAIAGRLAGEGAAVAITYNASPEKAEEVARAIEAAGGRALAIKADAADPGEVAAAVDHASAELGGLDILVNNAGIYLGGTLEEFGLDDFDRIVAVNIRAVFVASKAAATHMGEGGRIINIGSTNGDRYPLPGGAAYAMSKSALQGLTRGLARDLGPRGITVNNVQPGPVDTDMNPGQGEYAETLKKFLAVPRYGSSGEIAAMVGYLAGPESGFVTGASLTIDGGFGA